MVRSSGKQRPFSSLLDQPLRDPADGDDVIFASSLQRENRANDPTRLPAVRRPAVSVDDDEEIIFAQSWPGERLTSTLRGTAPVVAPAPLPAAMTTPMAAATPSPIAPQPVLAAPAVLPPVLTVLPVVPGVAARSVTFPMVDVDILWQDFDMEISQDLAAGHCPHCDDLLQVDPRQPTVTCSLCGSTYGTFHAWTREGNA